MTPDALKTLFTNPILWLVLAWVFREWWGHYKKTRRTLEDTIKAESTKLQASLKENTLEMHRLTISITEAKVKIESLERITGVIPKLAQDLNVAHERIRTIAPELYERKTSPSQL